MENQNKKQPVSAVKRGITGAVIGLAVMFIVVICTAASGTGGGFGISLAYLLAGPLYGFGLTFANWHFVMQETKKGAIYGAAGLGIGYVLSRLFDNKNWGIMGWLFCLLRVSWHLGFCWIPGIWYGIQAISQEKKEEEAHSVQPRPATAQTGSAARPAAASQISTPARSVPPQPAAPVRPAAPKPAPAFTAPARPTLTGVSGLFAGVEFPVQADEELAIGSDPSVCQIVLPAECAAPIHCSIRYDSRRGCWQARDLTDGQTFENGIRTIRTGVFEDIPKGRVLCIGLGKYSQRFRLG